MKRVIIIGIATIVSLMVGLVSCAAPAQPQTSATTIIMVDGKSMTIDEYNTVWVPAFNAKQDAFWQQINDSVTGQQRYEANQTYLASLSNGWNPYDEVPQFCGLTKSRADVDGRSARDDQVIRDCHGRVKDTNIDYYGDKDGSAPH